MEIVGYIVAGLFALSVMFEKCTKTITPWTKFFKFIGRAINGEVIERLNQLEAEVKENKQEHFAQCERRRIIDARVRILKFGDELQNDVRHSKDYFDQILLDITDYEHYCAKHPDFKNDITAMTVKHIKNVYSTCLSEHSFL